MADVVLALTQAAPTGVAAVPITMAIADNYKARNNGRVLLHFVKTGAGNANITIITPKTVGGLAVAEQVFVVPATTGDVYAGPFPADIYNDVSGDLDASTDEDTGITVEAIQI